MKSTTGRIVIVLDVTMRVGLHHPRSACVALMDEFLEQPYRSLPNFR
jgi:hypothetical protein